MSQEAGLFTFKSAFTQSQTTLLKLKYNRAQNLGLVWRKEYDVMMQVFEWNAPFLDLHLLAVYITDSFWMKGR